MIIGLTGSKGCGKSMFANTLVNEGLCVRMKFAGPLKDMCRALGLTNEMIEGSLKEVPQYFLGGKTPRYIMQTLGTEWGRGLISDTFWVDLLREALTEAQSKNLDVIIDDVRFENEVSLIKELGGYIVKIIRPSQEGDIKDRHLSETEMSSLESDVNHLNNNTLSQFEKMSMCIYEHLKTKDKEKEINND